MLPSVFVGGHDDDWFVCSVLTDDVVVIVIIVIIWLTAFNTLRRLVRSE